MAVTVYRWDDTSAPTLSASVGSLIGVLDACLVDGYGSKTAAGWTKAFSGTNVAAYKQGSGSTGMYLRVNNSVSSVSYSRVVAYEAMTDIDTGTSAMPTEAQISGGAYLYVSGTTDSTARPWILVADAKRFYLWIGYGLTTTQGVSGSSAYQPVYFFGDIVSYKEGDSYHCACIFNAGASSSSSVFAACTNMSSSVSGHYIMRGAGQVVGALPIAKYWDFYGSSSSSTSGSSSCVTYPDPVTGSFRMSRIYCSNGTASVATRGHFPGVWALLNALPGSPGDTFSGSGTLSGRTFLLLDAGSSGTRGRIAIETSDTWD